MKRIRLMLRQHLGHTAHMVEPAFHIGYLGLVFIEGHSFYALIAGGLALIVAVQWLAGE